MHMIQNTCQNGAWICAVPFLISLLPLWPFGADTAYVRVFISDVNDNKPAFVQRLYEVAVDEDADVGLAVVTVSANDEDEGMPDEATGWGGIEDFTNDTSYKWNWKKPDNCYCFVGLFIF